jgi:iron uptake system component EfeO
MRSLLPTRTYAGAALALTALLAVTACGSDEDGTSAGGDGTITVTSSDDACELSATEAPAGPVTFEVKNTGSDVTEFYVYGENDRVLSEVENIAPGLTREMTVELTEAGTYTTACKPGMVGDGIRGEFTITGSAEGAADSDAQLKEATADYKDYVDEQADELLEQTTAFVAAVKAGDVEQAKQLYPKAREPWERIEPVAESFGDLDPKIDGRADVVDDGMEFTGYHRLEKDLWVDGVQDDSSDIADQLLADVTDLVNRAKELSYDPLQLANGAKALVDEMATGKVTGEEERYSHTDLHDFYANYTGSMAAVDALRPALQERAPDLIDELDSSSSRLHEVIEEHERPGGRFVSYTSLSEGDVKELSDSLDAFSEHVAQVAGVVADQR